MYRTSKISPMLIIKDFDDNNPIHARMMENWKTIKKTQIKIRQVIPQHSNKMVKKQYYQEVEEQLVL